MNLNIKNLFVLIACVCFLNMNAQMSNVDQALTEVSGSENAVNGILEALPLITKASVHEKTKNHPKMYLVKSFVYASAFDYKNEEVIKEKKLGDIGKIAADCYFKYLELKKDNKYAEEESKIVAKVFIASYNEGFEPTVSKDSNLSLIYFYNNIRLWEIMSKVDTANYNFLEKKGIKNSTLESTLAFYSGVASNKELIKEVINNRVENNSQTAAFYELKYKSMLDLKDTIGAETFVRGVVEKFPNKQEFFNIMVNFYVSIGREEKLMEDVSKRLDENPDSRMYFIRGVLYEKLSANSTVKADRMRYNDLALADYTKATELDPANYDAYYNYAAIQQNVFLRRAIDKVNDTKDPEERKKHEAVYTNLLKIIREAWEVCQSNTKYSKEDMVKILTSLVEICDKQNDTENKDRYENLLNNLKS